MKKLLLILLCLPLIGFGQQCVPPDGCENGKGTYTWPKGDKYAGEWKDSKFHGQGTFTDSFGNQYEGKWKDGVNHGQGTLTDSLGNQYAGEWKDGIKHGQGTYTWSNGNNFDGQWENDLEWDGVLTYYEKDIKTQGLMIQYIYKNGNVTDTIRNDQNYYKPEDIIGEEIYCTIKLIDKITKYDIILHINNTPVKWRFDTGAEGFSIAKSLWEKIKSKIDFEDLNIIRKSKGIGGHSSGTVIRIKDEIEIGGYLVKNAIVSISNNDYSLMGIGFLKKFSNVEWNMKDATLKLYK